jgi:hypothetical protein
MTFQPIDVEDLKEPSWAATYTLLPDLRALASSLGTYGQMSPVLVQQSSMNIIDGIQRVRLVAGNKGLNAAFGGKVLCKVIDCNDIDAMVLHVQMNRARGQIVARSLSKIVKMLEMAGEYKKQDFENAFAMKFDELELMLDGSILKHRKVANHSYSRAWVPVEAPAGTVDKGDILIERPPNQDR